MRLVTGAVLVVTLVACGGGNTGAKATTAFASTTRAAWQSAASVSTQGMDGERRAATAWRGFAVTVQGAPAGKDAVAQGQLVALGNEAADAYTADVAAFECGVRATLDPGPGSCPPRPATAPDVFVAQIRQTVDGL